MSTACCAPLQLRVGGRYLDRAGRTWAIESEVAVKPLQVYPETVFLGRAGGLSAWFMPDGMWSATQQPTPYDLQSEAS